MVLKTRSCSLLTVANRSSPSAAIIVVNDEALRIKSSCRVSSWFSGFARASPWISRKLSQWRPLREGRRNS